MAPHESRDREVVFVGRCKRCKAGRRTEVVERFRSYTERFRTVQGYDNERTRYRYSYPVLRLSEQAEALAVVQVVCDCGSPLFLKRVRGVRNDHVCDARCMNATGPNCECSCGGKNHGASHSHGALVAL